MKLICIYLEDNYKSISKGQYIFDNEFIIEEFNSTNKSIKLKANNSYNKLFNDSIQNITCIVGQNGIGKTTFFELLIAPLIWRLDGEALKGKLHLLFYDELLNEFLLESYIDNAQNWKLSVDSISKTVKKNIYLQNENKLDKNLKYPLSNNKYSVLPFQVNIIFHSLSPFDRIYFLLKQKLSDSPDIVEHYHKRFKYIGIKQIENDEISYEYMTLINLLNLFFREDSKKMINQIGYAFKNIKIELISEYFNSLPIIPPLEDLDLDIFKNITKNYSYIKSLFKYKKICDFNDDFFDAIMIKNLDISSRKQFETFLFFIEKTYPTDNMINSIEQFIQNIQLHINEESLFYANQYNFLKELVQKKVYYQNLKLLENDESLREIVGNQEIYEYLHCVKSLTRRNIANFNINLQKKEQAISYFQLSSGEKTLLSYFANILGRINELAQIQAKDSTYSTINNKLFFILIDEVELHLHPEWQRNFIKYINDFFYSQNQNLKLQFIIATHSPFVVSDIYDSNIIYLGQNNKKTKTFGGNIFDIFKDDFYVVNTIGAFSESIIKELSEFLYFLFVFKKAKNESNFFPLRDFLDLMYQDTSNKDQENQALVKNIESYIIEENVYPDLMKMSSNKYLSTYRNNPEIFFKQTKNIMDKIGENVIKQHLEKMYLYLKEEE